KSEQTCGPGSTPKTPLHFISRYPSPIRREICLPKAYISVLQKPDLPGNMAIRGQYGRFLKFCVKLHPFCAFQHIQNAPAGGGGTSFSDGDSGTGTWAEVRWFSSIRERVLEGKLFGNCASRKDSPT